MTQTLAYTQELTIAMPVSNLDASLKWYTEKLGFELLYKLDEMGWAELKTCVPGVNMGLSQVENHKPGGPTPTFGVENIKVGRAALEAQDVKFDGETIVIEGMVALATFFDPDRNSLMLFEGLNENA